MRQVELADGGNQTCPAGSSTGLSLPAVAYTPNKQKTMTVNQKPCIMCKWWLVEGLNPWPPTINKALSLIDHKLVIENDANKIIFKPKFIIELGEESH